MRKKIGTLLILGSLGALCAGLCACKDETLIEEYYKNGNIISVTYDGSGGNILGGDNVSIVDMFNPEKYQADEDGYIHIKLRSPTDTARPTSGVDNIKVTRRGYSLVGWYRERNLVTDGDGNALDDDGNKLTERNGSYYRITTDKDGNQTEEKAVPAYTYSEPWDFKSDTVDFKKGDEKLDMTLYAAWTKLFTFEYYYKPTSDSEWTLFGTTEFDYPEAQTAKDDGKVLDSVFVPDWSVTTGRMEHKYSDVYTFPSVKDMTFEAAYSDEACEKEITVGDPLQHAGWIDYATAKAIDPVQKVYVKFKTGNYYRIANASQFSAIGDAAGYYTILSDLDFNCSLKDNALVFGEDSVRWPAGLSVSEFTGRIEGEDGKPIKFLNVGAQYNVGDRNAGDYSNATAGGLFGSIGKGAVIRNLSFENVIFDIQVATSSLEANFGMFAGDIAAKADCTVENVTIGGQMLLGRMRNTSEKGCHFNLIANGNENRVQKTEIVLTIYGQTIYSNGSSEETGDYSFEIDPTPGKTTVDADGNISFVNTPVTVEDRRFQGQYHTVQYQTVNGGQDNE